MVARALQVNTELKTLDLYGNIVENDSIILMTEALKMNTALETLVLPCPQPDLNVESCAAISAALKEKHVVDFVESASECSLRRWLVAHYRRSHFQQVPTKD